MAEGEGKWAPETHDTARQCTSHMRCALQELRAFLVRKAAAAALGGGVKNKEEAAAAEPLEAAASEAAAVVAASASEAVVAATGSVMVLAGAGAEPGFAAPVREGRSSSPQAGSGDEAQGPSMETEPLAAAAEAVVAAVGRRRPAEGEMGQWLGAVEFPDAGGGGRRWPAPLVGVFDDDDNDGGRCGIGGSSGDVDEEDAEDIILGPLPIKRPRVAGRVAGGGGTRVGLRGTAGAGGADVTGADEGVARPHAPRGAMDGSRLMRSEPGGEPAHVLTAAPRCTLSGESGGGEGLEEVPRRAEEYRRAVDYNDGLLKAPAPQHTRALARI